MTYRVNTGSQSPLFINFAAAKPGSILTKTIVGNGWEARAGRWQDSPPVRVDHIVSDPPFTKHVSAKAKQREGLYNRQSGKVEPKPGRGALSFGGIEASELGPALVPFARRWTVLFTAIEQIGHYADACPEHWVRGCIWTKTNPSPQFTGDRPGMWGESIAVLHAPGKKRWNRGGHAGIWHGGRRNHGQPFDEQIHETQKPLWLMAELIEAFTDPGELVWDPYMGSATTGVACLLTGRRFLGHELQDGTTETGVDYFTPAVERLRAAELGQPVSDHRAGQATLF